MPKFWPVFLSRAMHDDRRACTKVGDEISWNVLLVDGESEGWPRNILVPTSVEITEAPAEARRGSVARTPQLTVAWGGAVPLGSRFDLLALLVADWFNPPFQTTVTGCIQRLYTAWESGEDAGAKRHDMRLVEAGDEIRSLSAARAVGGYRVAGLVAELDVNSSCVAAFPPR